jgi:hypothetical protein
MATTTDRIVPDRKIETSPDLTTSVVIASERPASGAMVVADMEGARGSDEKPDGAEVGENLVWEGRYSMHNFLVRTIAAVLLTIFWALLGFDVWGLGRVGYQFLAMLVGLATLTFWGYLGVKALRARHSHHYRLTTSRLFVSNGFFHRRVDQIELRRIKDLYLQQTMMNHWLNVGTVVVISSEPSLPKAALLGINRPQFIMDLIWQHTRREQEPQQV